MPSSMTFKAPRFIYFSLCMLGDLMKLSVGYISSEQPKSSQQRLTQPIRSQDTLSEPIRSQDSSAWAIYYIGVLINSPWLNWTHRRNIKQLFPSSLACDPLNRHCVYFKTHCHWLHMSTNFDQFSQRDFVFHILFEDLKHRLEDSLIKINGICKHQKHVFLFLSIL